MNRWRHSVRPLGLALLAACLVVVGVQIWAVAGIPVEMRLLPGQEIVLPHSPLVTVVEFSEAGWLAPKERGAATVRGGELGETRLQVRLFGLLPVRSVRVSVVPELSVVPGGQAIGVLVSAQGLVVGGTLPVMDVDGQMRSPARDGGIVPGDVIAEIGDEEVFSVEQVHELVDRFGRRGERMDVVVLRHGARLARVVEPAPVRDASAEDGIGFRIGAALETPAIGVGTLTFYDPVALRFGGLGHMITDGLNNRVEVSDGRIVEAMIRGIQQGARGFPGEKIGAFDSTGAALGGIEKNTPFGIYGSLFREPDHGLVVDPIPVALAHEVRTGDAQVLTVVEGRQVESFQLRILQVHPNRRHDGRGLVIQITDERLLDRTKGIVQGMSGSPIVQDGKLVGAVTHVFVNDPTRGYGILAEWMAYEAELLQIISESKQENTLP